MGVGNRGSGIGRAGFLPSLPDRGSRPIVPPGRPVVQLGGGLPGRKRPNLCPRQQLGRTSQARSRAGPPHFRRARAHLRHKNVPAHGNQVPARRKGVPAHRASAPARGAAAPARPSSAPAHGKTGPAPSGAAPARPSSRPAHRAAAGSTRGGPRRPRISADFGSPLGASAPLCEHFFRTITHTEAQRHKGMQLAAERRGSARPVRAPLLFLVTREEEPVPSAAVFRPRSDAILRPCRYSRLGGGVCDGPSRKLALGLASSYGTSRRGIQQPSTLPWNRCDAVPISRWKAWPTSWPAILIRVELPRMPSRDYPNGATRMAPMLLP